MNLLARNDLQMAHALITTLRERPMTPNPEAINALIETTLNLCHVCQALAEDNEELRKALRDHTNRQDAHNF